MTIMGSGWVIQLSILLPSSHGSIIVKVISSVLAEKGLGCKREILTLVEGTDSQPVYNTD